MLIIEIITVLALFQYITFAALVGKARSRYGVQAPAVTGHEIFERYYRVQMNTLELLVVFLPSLWMAAHYWSPGVVGSIGSVYLLGRILYFRAYISAPEKRGIGFVMSMMPAVLLLIATLVGAAIK